MDYRINLTELVERKDVIGALNLLKSLGVSKRYICKRSGVSETNFYKWESGVHQTIGEDKKDQILNAIKHIYLGVSNS